MKPIRIVLFVVAAMVVGGAVAGGVYMAAHSMLGSHKEATLNCNTRQAAEYIVTIKGDQLDINDIHAKPCDTLTIINADQKLRLMAFGVHDHHQTYAGLTEQTLRPNDRMTIRLTQRGSYTFHDHLSTDIDGRFTVQ